MKIQNTIFHFTSVTRPHIFSVLCDTQRINPSMKFSFKQVLPHLLVVLSFIVIALLYFNPVLSGKRIYQNDIKLYEGMAKQQRDFRAETGEETFWTNSAFGGMPTYQLGARFPHDYMDKLDRLIRFLPRPADYLFLYFISFYILMLVMRLPWKYALLGALAFGLSTYLIIIIGVGHNSKVHAIGYFPLVLSGIILTFRGRYLWGFLLTAVAMGLEIQANHLQMTYYLGLLCVILGLAYLVDAFRKQQLPHFFKSVGLMILAVALGIATNATTILSTIEYSKTSTRGDKLLVDETSEGDKKAGLDYDYITNWSYGKLESINLIAPKFMGVGTAADLGRDSEFVKKLSQLQVEPSQLNYYAQITRLYWGEQPFVEAPPYVGVTVFALALLGFFLIRGRLKWWLLGGIIMSLLLSWGKNLDWLTRFFVDYIPLYNKFRAITSIQVILELCLPIAAVFGLHRFLNDSLQDDKKRKRLFIAFGSLIGLLAILYFFSGSLFNLRSSGEGQMAIEQPEILDAIKADRLTILKADVLRSLLLVLALGGALWLLFIKKISENIGIIIIGCIILFDLVTVDRRSVNEDNFITKRAYENNFEQTPADKQIAEDDGYFRVLDQYRGFENSHTSYYFNSINGYSAVKPRRMDDLYYGQIAQNNVGILNMYNVKYVIQNNKDAMYVQTNPYANGPAWYVNEIQYVPDYNAEYESLKKLDTKNIAVMREKYRSELGNYQPQRDSTASVQVLEVEPNYIKYETSNGKDGFMVFSENYYKNGWKATIDGQESQIFPVNYALRGLKVPAGKHTIVFVFDPQVVKTGGAIMLGSSLLLLLLLGGAVFVKLKNSKEESHA